MKAAHGEMRNRKVVLVSLWSEGVVGWGECSALNEPTYNEEWSDGEYHLLRGLILPRLIAGDDPKTVLRAIRGHHSSKAAIELALLDIKAQQCNTSVAALLRAEVAAITPCLVIGANSREAMHAQVYHLVSLGVNNLKCKVANDADIGNVESICRTFPSVRVGVDTNGLFMPHTEQDRLRLSKLDALELAFIEQPFDADNLRAYAELRAMLETPIFLDESIRSAQHLRTAIDLGMCDGVTLKPSQVGGYDEALRAAAIAREFGIKVRLGGMLETGIGRAANIALGATSPFLSMAAEVSPDGYWYQDNVMRCSTQIMNGKLQVAQQNFVDDLAVERLANASAEFKHP